MAKTMAAVLAEHYLQFKWDRNSGVTFWFCRSCEFATEDFEQAAAHQAAALSAAGYGLVADAKREAWDEGKDAVWTFMSNQDPRRERPTNPYREASNDDQ